MTGARLLILVPAFVLGLEGAASACSTLREDYIIGYSDAVVDGVATCNLDRGVCRLRAGNVVKEDARRRSGSRLYVLRFEPGGVDRMLSQDAAAGDIVCPSLWEPRAERLEGRFYLDRERGAYRARIESVRGVATNRVEEE
jgi:hypothetical protein